MAWIALILSIVAAISSGFAWVSRDVWKREVNRLQKAMNYAKEANASQASQLNELRVKHDDLARQNTELLQRHREECNEYESRMRANAEAAEQREKLLREEMAEWSNKLAQAAKERDEAREQRDEMIKHATEWARKTTALRARYTLSRQQNSSVVAMTIRDPQARRDVDLLMTAKEFAKARTRAQNTHRDHLASAGKMIQDDKEA